MALKTSDEYRQDAARVRRVARQMSDAKKQLEMEEIAANYERLAVLAEEREGKTG